MSAPYNSNWQSSFHSTEYRPPLTPSDVPQSYPLYPPQPNYTTERSNAPNGHSYNPAFKPPQSAEMRGRTPSPTPSEQKELSKGAIDWKAMMRWQFWIRREWLWYYVALVVIIVLTALMTLYHKQIVDWLTPVTRWLHDLSFGWVVPIAILFVISFPPLFGHEIVAILCGLVWGMWVGFGIVAAGTFLGEVGNFYAFKYCCRARGEKLERTNISYACLAQVVREGGFKIALVARLSAIPGHFTTAIFSTCGMNIFVFSVAAILSMPKQFITVYLGVLIEQSADGTTDTRSRIISDVVLAITVLITVAAMWYILRKMDQVKPAVIYARRKARQAKLERQQITPSSTPSPGGHARNPSYATIGYTHSDSSESHIPLTTQATPMGYNNTPGFPQVTHFQEPSEETSYGTYLHAPKPQRPGGRIPSPSIEEDDLASAQPLQSNFDPLDGRQASYSPAFHGSFNPSQPLPSSSESPYGPRVPVSLESSSLSRQPQQNSLPSGHRFPPQPQYDSFAQPPLPSTRNTTQVQAEDPFASSYDHVSLVPAPHVREDPHGLLHAAPHTASPEPMTVDDHLPPRAAPQPPSISMTAREQDPPAQSQWNQPPPGYYNFAGR